MRLQDRPSKIVLMYDISFAISYLLFSHSSAIFLYFLSLFSFIHSHTYLLFLSFFLSSYLPSFLPSYLPSFLPSFLPIFLLPSSCLIQGCGKTIQAIGVMQHYRQHWPVLMLVPVSMTYQWAAELLKFSSDLLRDKDIFIAKKVSCDSSSPMLLCCVQY